MSSESEVDEECMCGIGSWKPKWLQKFANPKIYLLNSCVQGMVQGAYLTYFVGVLSTIEKRYAFDSTVSGAVLVSDNVSAAITGIIIGYYGGKVHRPRMIAAGMMIAALGCVLMIIPYLIYGPALHLLSDHSLLNEKPKPELCEVDREEHCESGSSTGTILPVCLIIIANILNGIGSTAFYIIGTPYLDDNVKKKSSPMYLGFMFAIRLFGPSLGFLLASFSLQFYEDPTYDPGITQKDPRFVGAWWLGYLILAFLIVLTSLPMFLFPRYMKKPQSGQDEQQTHVIKKSQDSLPKLKDLPKEWFRLAKNPILVFHTLGCICRVHGFMGFYSFQPKYLEVQFHQTASEASLFTGSTSVAIMLVGVLCGGYLVKRWKPRPRYLVAYIIMNEIIMIGALFGVTFISCPNVQMPDTKLSGSELILENPCNTNCSCTTRIFQPVCGPDGKSSYFSPCFAGCEETPPFSNETSFSNCTCVRNSDQQFSIGDVVDGFCDTKCQTFLMYMVLLSVPKMIASTGRVGEALIALRCIDPADKTLALGAIDVLLSVCAFIPYLVFGALTDAACLVWERKCGRTGNCWMYDVDKFRFYLHGTVIIFLVVGAFFDILVYFLADRIPEMYEEIDADPKKAVDAEDAQTNAQTDVKKSEGEQTSDVTSF